MIQKKRSFNGPKKKIITRDFPKIYTKLLKGSYLSNFPEKKLKSFSGYLASLYKLIKITSVTNTKTVVVGHLKCDYKISNNNYLYVRYLTQNKKIKVSDNKNLLNYNLLLKKLIKVAKENNCKEIFCHTWIFAEHSKIKNYVGFKERENKLINFLYKNFGFKVRYLDIYNKIKEKNNIKKIIGFKEDGFIAITNDDKKVKIKGIKITLPEYYLKLNS